MSLWRINAVTALTCRLDNVAGDAASSHRAVIPIVDRYILRQVARPVATALLIGLLVLLAERLVRMLDTTLGKKNSFAVVFELLAYLLPHFLGLAVPVALFLGLLFGFNKLSKDSEIDAFLASGIGLARLVRPVFALSLVLFAASVFIVGWAQPYTRYTYRSLLFEITNVDVFYLAEEGVFMRAGTRTFIIDKLDRSSNRFDRLFLFDDKGEEGSETLTATRGALLEDESEGRPMLRLDDGVRLKIGKVSKNPQEPLPLPVVSRFLEAVTPLGRIGDRIFRPRGDDERELTLFEVWQQLDHPPKNTTPERMLAEFHKRLIDMAMPVLLPILAVPFAIGRKRDQRTYNFGLAVILLVAVYELIERGAVATRVSGATPFLTMWLPFSLVAIFAAWRFWRAAYVLKPSRLAEILERVGGLIVQRARNLLRRIDFVLLSKGR